MKRVLLIFMLVFIFQSCIKNPVSPPATSQLDGKWNILINSDSGFADFQTVNNLLSGSITFDFFTDFYTLNGSFNDTTLNFNFRAYVFSFGESIWKFTGQYDLSNLSMGGLLNIYKYSNDSLAYSDLSWFARKDTTAVSFR